MAKHDSRRRRRRILILTGQVNGTKARILINGGSQLDLISIKFVEDHRLPPGLAPAGLRVQLAGGQIQDASVVTQPIVSMGVERYRGAQRNEARGVRRHSRPAVADGCQPPDQLASEYHAAMERWEASAHQCQCSSSTAPPWAAVGASQRQHDQPGGAAQTSAQARQPNLL